MRVAAGKAGGESPVRTPARDQAAPTLTTTNTYDNQRANQRPLNFILISLSAYRMFMSSPFSLISGNVCYLIYFSLYTVYTYAF